MLPGASSSMLGGRYGGDKHKRTVDCWRQMSRTQLALLKKAPGFLRPCIANQIVFRCLFVVTCVVLLGTVLALVVTHFDVLGGGGGAPPIAIITDSAPVIKHEDAAPVVVVDDSSSIGAEPEVVVVPEKEEPQQQQPDPVQDPQDDDDDADGKAKSGDGDFFGVGAAVDADSVWAGRRDSVKAAMVHAWTGYRNYAWGHDELLPESDKPNDSWGGFGITLVDSLDTLILMGLDDELAEARKFVETIDYVKDFAASFFETSIRHVGGLLGAFELTRDQLFLDKAREVTDALMPSFGDAENHDLPRSIVNMKTGEAKNHAWTSKSSILAEVGSIQLEFAHLTHHSGVQIYNNKAQAVFELLDKMDKPERGLYPLYINPSTATFRNKRITFGGLADSFYEYLLKLWILRDKDDERSLRMYQESITAMLDKLLVKVPARAGSQRTEPYTFVREIDGSKHVDKMEHLTCFVGGLLALGTQHFRADSSSAVERQLFADKKRHLQAAEAITESCVAMYTESATGIAPESIRFDVKNGGFRADQKYYILRPETVESLFVLWRTTHDVKYREWGWQIFQAIEKHCRTDSAYTSLKDVTSNPPKRDDSMQSFFLAETLKYLYLLFSDDTLLPLDEFVFTTEAHALRILKAT